MSRGCCAGLGWERVVAKWSLAGVQTVNFICDVCW